MFSEELLKKFLKKFKKIFPSENLEKELIPLQAEEHLKPKIGKKKKVKI